MIGRLARDIFRLLAGLALAGCGGLAPPGGGLPRGYDLLLSPQAHAFRFAEPPEPVRRGNRSERFELRDGDCGGSDCMNPRYRSEIQLEGGAVEAQVGGDIWYGWSFRNASVPSFSAQNTLRVVVGQWKLSGEADPAFRLVQMGVGEGNWSGCNPTLCTRGGDPTADVAIQLADMAARNGWGMAQNDGHVCRLFSMAEARTRWMDIVVNTNFSAGADGYLRVWVNGVQRCDYRGQVVATLDAAGANRPNHRRGIFASYTERWAASEGARPKPVMVVYYDEFLVGGSRDQVDTALREQRGLDPRD